MIMGFVYEYMYQDSEYKIGTMNTKHAQCTCYTAKPIHTVFLLQAAHKIAPSHSKHICDQVAFAVLTSSS